MLELLEKREEIEQIVREINEAKKNKNYHNLSNAIKILVDLYIGIEINDEIKSHIEKYLESIIILAENSLELEEDQTIIRIEDTSIRQGAWSDGNEEKVDINYFHPLKISKYVRGFTCGNLKYEFDYPNQLIETTSLNKQENSYIIYRYTGQNKEVLEVLSTKVAEYLFELQKKQTIYVNQKIIKETTEVINYEETPFENIEIINQENKTFKKVV